MLSILSDIAGKIDPYAVIKCWHVQRKTRISEGNNPIWDFETEIEVIVGYYYYIFLYYYIL